MTTVAFDVDGTLIHQSGEDEGKPRHKIVNLFNALESVGCTMTIWSHDEEHAKIVAKQLGLVAEIKQKPEGAQLFTSYVPDITIDNDEINYGMINIKV